MTKKTIHLGYEVGTGQAVAIPVGHLCVTGQSQLSGKTTTLEALISRSGLKAIAFVTKRGEGAFLNVGVEGSGLPNRLLAPFFRHKADWQFVSELLGAVLNEKLKWERYWIIKICRNASSLSDVLANAEKWLDSTKKSQDVQVLTTIVEYFKLFMPDLKRLPYTNKLELQVGVNVMDLSDYPLPLQMLVISAVVEEVYTHHKNVITLIPEAWEFIPNGKNSPAKAAVRTLIRKGAGLGNFVWIDSQDLAGVDPEVRRQASANLLLGVQRDQNEVKRTLEHIPKVPKKLTAEDIMTLLMGQFWACFAGTVVKTYVQPAWMSEQRATGIAIGELPMTGWLSGPLPVPELSTVSILNTEKLRAQFTHTPFTHTPFTHTPFTHTPPGIPFEVNDSPTAAHVLASTEYHLDQRTMTDSRPQSVIDDEQKEIERMDREQREQYEEQIRILTDEVKRLSGLVESGKEIDRQTATPRFDYESSGQNMRTRTVSDELLAKRLLPHLLPLLPAGGVVKVEPREVVLNRFQQNEVERILQAAEALPPFSKRLIALIEARGQGVKKSAAVSTVTGKWLQNMARDCADEYEQIRSLAATGWIREDTKNSVVFPNLAKLIKARTGGTEPSNEDVDAIVGQVMLKLN